MSEEEKDIKEAYNWLCALEVTSEWEQSNKILICSILEEKYKWLLEK